MCGCENQCVFFKKNQINHFSAKPIAGCRTEFNVLNFDNQPVVRQLDRVREVIFLNSKKVLIIRHYETL